LNHSFDYVEFLDCLRECLGLGELPYEAPPQPHPPFSLDGGVTFLTTKGWQLRLGLTKQAVLYRRARALGAADDGPVAASAVAHDVALDRRA